MYSSLRARSKFINAMPRTAPLVALRCSNLNLYTSFRHNSSSATEVQANIETNTNSTVTTPNSNSTNSDILKDKENTVLTNKELEMLRIKGGRMEFKQISAIANILKYRMISRLPTLLEFQGPQATLNSVKAICFANSSLKARKKIENVTEEEFSALESYLQNKQDFKIESDFQYYTKFSQHKGYSTIADIVADHVVESDISESESERSESDTAVPKTSVPKTRQVDPDRIDFDISGKERNKAILDKLSRRKSGDSAVQHVLVAPDTPLTLGLIPSQFRVQDDQGYRFVMRLEPVIIAEPKNISREKCKLIFPPRDRDMLFQSATILRKLWTEHLEQNGPELLCCAAGAESTSRVIKMLECANTLQEKNSGVQFCVRPQIIREVQRDQEIENKDQLRFHYQFDFYAL